MRLLWLQLNPIEIVRKMSLSTSSVCIRFGCWIGWHKREIYKYIYRWVPSAKRAFKLCNTHKTYAYTCTEHHKKRASETQSPAPCCAWWVLRWCWWQTCAHHFHIQKMIYRLIVNAAATHDTRNAEAQAQSWGRIRIAYVCTLSVPLSLYAPYRAHGFNVWNMFFCSLHTHLSYNTYI